MGVWGENSVVVPGCTPGGRSRCGARPPTFAGARITRSPRPLKRPDPLPNPDPIMDFSKLYRPSALNSFQFVALTGLVMSAAAHLILAVVVSRVPPGFNWLYLCWLLFYAGGTLLNYFGKPNAGHHHHDEPDNFEQ